MVPYTLVFRNRGTRRNLHCYLEFCLKKKRAIILYFCWAPYVVISKRHEARNLKGKL